MKRKDIVSRAEEFCREQRINSYPVNIVGICNDMGIEVYEQYLPPNVSGFIGVDDSLKEKYDSDKVIVVNLSGSAKRRRFTIAHELAHYVLHRKPEEKLYAHRDAGQSDRIEWEANTFASNILMPKRLVKKALKRLYDEDLFVTFGEKIQYIANEFKVSRDAAEVCLEALDED